MVKEYPGRNRYKNRKKDFKKATNTSILPSGLLAGFKPGWIGRIVQAKVNGWLDFLISLLECYFIQ